MDINFENKYAYGEVCAILDWLGDDYKSKVPKKLLRLFKEERKFGYRPQFDFSKPLNHQVRQETINIIAYLEHSFWLNDESKRQMLKQTINNNSKVHKKKLKQERSDQKVLNTKIGLNAQLDDALKSLK